MVAVMPGGKDIDPLLEAYRKELDRQLSIRNRHYYRIDAAAQARAEKVGNAGPLEVTLSVPRHRWPTAHELTTTEAIPIRTRVTNDPRRVTVTTTRRGALRLSTITKRDDLA